MKDQIEERSSQLLRNLSSCESRSSLNFFQAFFSQLLKLRSNCEDLSSIWSFIRSSNICFIYLHSFIHPSRVYYDLTIWPAPSWLDSSVGRALHRHRRGHGFESRSSLNFFQAFFSQLLKLRSNCEDLSSIWVLLQTDPFICWWLKLSVISLSALVLEEAERTLLFTAWWKECM